MSKSKEEILSDINQMWGQPDAIADYILNNFCPNDYVMKNFTLKESCGMPAVYAPVGSLIITPDKVEALKLLMLEASRFIKSTNATIIRPVESDYKKQLAAEAYNHYSRFNKILEEILNPKTDGKFADGGTEK